MVIYALLGSALAHVPVLYGFEPGDDWCSFVRQESTTGSGAEFYPGDVLLLAPGVHAGCTFTGPVTDTPAEFTIIQSEDPADPARFSGPVHVSGTQVMLLALAFESTVDSPAITLSGNALWTRFSAFTGPGTALAVRGDALDIWLLDNTFSGNGTGIDAGCDGCQQDVHVRNSVFRGLDRGVYGWGGTSLEATGLAMQDVGLGIRVGGAASSSLTANLLLDCVEGVRFEGAGGMLRSSIIRGTTAVSSDPGAAPRVLGNTLLGEVALSDWDERVSNAWSLEVDGNVRCDADCFVDASNDDFYPAPGSPLLVGGASARDDALFEDFCERERVEPRTAGAVQSVGDESWGPFIVGMRDDQPCVTGLPASTETPGYVEPRGGCGCGSGVSAGAWLVGVAALVARRRRSSTRAHR